MNIKTDPSADVKTMNIYANLYTFDFDTIDEEEALWRVVITILILLISILVVCYMNMRKHARMDREQQLTDLILNEIIDEIPGDDDKIKNGLFAAMTGGKS